MSGPDSDRAFEATIAMATALASTGARLDQIAADLPRMFEALCNLRDTQAAEPDPAAVHVEPAVSIRKSLASSSHIISMIDGKPYKTLRRHLATNGLTPETYRERYGLPATYPMVAPDYSAARKAMALKIGLGRKKA